MSSKNQPRTVVISPELLINIGDETIPKALARSEKRKEVSSLQPVMVALSLALTHKLHLEAP